MPNDTSTENFQVSVERDEQLTQSLQTLVALYAHDLATLTEDDSSRSVYQQIHDQLQATLESADRVAGEVLESSH